MQLGPGGNKLIFDTDSHPKDRGEKELISGWACAGKMQESGLSSGLDGLREQGNPVTGHFIIFMWETERMEQDESCYYGNDLGRSGCLVIFLLHSGVFF